MIYKWGIRGQNRLIEVEKMTTIFYSLPEIISDSFRISCSQQRYQLNTIFAVFNEYFLLPKILWKYIFWILKNSFMGIIFSWFLSIVEPMTSFMMWIMLNGIFSTHNNIPKYDQITTHLYATMSNETESNIPSYSCHIIHVHTVLWYESQSNFLIICHVVLDILPIHLDN